MDELVGFEKTVIVDAMVTGENEPGTIRSISVSDLVTTKNIISTHDSNLSTALEMGRIIGLSLPSEIKIFGIEAKVVNSFSEELSEEVAKAVPVLVDRIMQELTE